MLSRALTVAALICCTLVGLSFALFAVDQASHATKRQVSELATQSTPNASSQAPTSHGQPRRFIDDAGRTLTSPFRSLIGSGSQWSLEGISTLLALVVYGLGLGYLARYARVT